MKLPSRDCPPLAVIPIEFDVFKRTKLTACKHLQPYINIGRAGGKKKIMLCAKDVSNLLRKPIILLAQLFTPWSLASLGFCVLLVFTNRWSYSGPPNCTFEKTQTLTGFPLILPSETFQMTSETFQMTSGSNPDFLFSSRLCAVFAKTTCSKVSNARSAKPKYQTKSVKPKVLTQKCRTKSVKPKVLLQSVKPKVSNH